MLVKFILNRKVLNVITAYALQVGVNESDKRQFWDDLDEMIWEYQGNWL